MTREAFLAVSGLDKLTEMESVGASSAGTSESPLTQGSSGYCHLHLQNTFLQIQVGLICLHNEWIDNLDSISTSTLKIRYGKYDTRQPIQVDLS